MLYYIPQDRGHETFCGFQFAVFHENLTLEVSIDEIKERENHEKLCSRKKISAGAGN